jgi:hypothetical protein
VCERGHKSSIHPVKPVVHPVKPVVYPVEPVRNLCEASVHVVPKPVDGIKDLIPFTDRR